MLFVRRPNLILNFLLCSQFRYTARTIDNTAGGWLATHKRWQNVDGRLVVLCCQSRTYLPTMARDNEIMNSAFTQFRTFKFLHGFFTEENIRTGVPLSTTELEM
jgi:hypothetical protein